MGKRGPKPKPTAVRLFTGARISRPSGRKDEPVPPSKSISPAPHWLGVHGKKEWETTGPILFAVGCLTEADQSLFAQYCHAIDMFHRARLDLAKQGLKVSSSKGTEMLNPNYTVLRDAKAMIVKIGGMFGMAPSSRVGLSGAPADTGFDDLENFKRGVS